MHHLALACWHLASKYCLAPVNYMLSGTVINVNNILPFPLEKTLNNYRPQRSCSKVMFYTYLSFCLWWGVSGRHPPEQTPHSRQTPPPRDGHCSRWYASYWNAFLFDFCLVFEVSRRFSICRYITDKQKWHGLLQLTRFQKCQATSAGTGTMNRYKMAGDTGFQDSD